LALAAVHQFKALDLPLPGAIFAGTPWADLTKTGDTLFTNEGLDRVIVTYDGTPRAAARLYAGSHSMRDPLISPVYGSFERFPPTILISGTRDMLLSDTVRTHQKLLAAGTVAELHVFEAHSHAEYIDRLRLEPRFRWRGAGVCSLYGQNSAPQASLRQVRIGPKLAQLRY
jgi:acetyl esterase/lipase